MSFKFEMEDSRRRHDSRIILALDSVHNRSGNLLSKSIEILKTTHPYICALKLNRHLILPLGLFHGIQKLLKAAHNLGLPVIMDCKINDVGYTNQVITENYFKAGFDAVIANPFIGWNEGLQSVFKIANQMERGVLLLIYMSHKAAWEGYGQIVQDKKNGKFKSQYIVFAEKALKWKADGAIVGATYPEKIKEIKAVLGGEVPIYSPGIGVQGGVATVATRYGSDFLIVGRAITLSDKPDFAANEFRNAANNAIC